jgi:predicted ribosome quality control (RQC) complex YloA/Tae2 family protein
LQQVDFTTLTAACQEVAATWIPARVETFYQLDRYTIAIGLRNLQGRGWLALSWHPEAARIVLTEPPPRLPDTFTFSQQLRHQLGGLALVAIQPVAPWERLMDLQFAPRPGEAPIYHLFVEVMGKYSNATLTDADRLIIATAHQVSGKQSAVRTVQTGQPYELPPRSLNTLPSLSESLASWQARVSLVPGLVTKKLISNYQGLSTALTQAMLVTAAIKVDATTPDLTAADWQRLFAVWQQWQGAVTEGQAWQPGWTATGYNVLGWGAARPAPSVNQLLDEYFTNILNHTNFQQLRHQLTQKLGGAISKLEVKAQTFRSRLADSAAAEELRAQADLLTAYLHLWQSGMSEMILTDFATEQPVTIPLNPEKSGSQNAQSLYKKYQKLKRAQSIVLPLLSAVQAELDYLVQIEASISQIESYQQPSDLETLAEIKEELIQTGYLAAPNNRSKAIVLPETQPRKFTSPSGFEVLVGRNNRQNDRLTFKTATDYDLWFHAQEISGSHGLLRLPAGAVPADADLQYVANLMAYHSRSRQSEAVPVVYTATKHVYKPKGAQLGMVIYKHEQVIWGHPQRVDLAVK